MSEWSETGETGMMRQQAPFPTILASLCERLTYRPDWQIQLVEKDRGQGSVGLTLIITTRGYNSYHPEEGENYSVNHFFPVPPAAFNEKSWQRWLLNRLLMVERHEACEFFEIDGERPYAPNHGPGNDPYIIFDHATDEEARTSFRGDVKEEQKA